MGILEQAELFKTMNRPDSTMTLFDGLFLGKFWRKWRKILIQSWFKSSICDIKIWNQYLTTQPSRQFSADFFIITFDWKGNFKFWWFYRKDLFQIHQNQSYFKFLKNLFIHKNQFLGEKINVFFAIFFTLLPKFSDFVNSDDCIK